jgi:hypothetical protein
MKVIKVVRNHDGQLTSTFASGKWMKVYKKGVTTTPDKGYLFTLSIKDMDKALAEFCTVDEVWYAEAEVVGKVYQSNITVFSKNWSGFWRTTIPQSKGDYLLCKSITLTKKIGILGEIKERMAI